MSQTHAGDHHELRLDVSEWRKSRHRISARVRVQLESSGEWLEDTTLHTDDDEARHRFWANLLSKLLLLYPDSTFPNAQALDARLVQLAAEAEIEATAEADDTRAISYIVDADGNTRMRTTAGDESVDSAPLANFAARIVTDLRRDDGSGRTERWLEIEAVVRGTRSVVTVPANHFESLDWVLTELGPMAIIAAGATARAHMRAAIQFLSGEPRRHTVYTQLGWREIGGELVYLHAGGGIDRLGPTSGVDVDVWDALRAYRLPPPPADAKPLVERFFEVVRELPDAATLPLAATIVGAPLDALVGGLQGVVVLGPTGSLKSSLIAALLHLAGGPFSAREPVVTFESTANALERLTFLAAQTPLWIDDFRPSATRSERDSSQQAAQRVFRGARTRAGRERLASDATARVRYRPRCPVISSAELLPLGTSTMARCFVVPMPDLDLGKLTTLQDTAAADFALLGASWVRYLAEHYASLGEVLPPRIASSRVEIVRRCPELHLGLDDALARLLVAWDTFLTFAQDVGGCDDFDGSLWHQRALDAFQHVAVTANSYAIEAQPEEEYLELVRQLLEANEICISGLEGFSEVGEDAGWYDPAAKWIYLKPSIVDPLVARRYGLLKGLPLPLDVARRALQRRSLLARTEPPHLTVKARRPGAKRTERALVLELETVFP